MSMGCARVTCVGFVGMQPLCGESSNAEVRGNGKAENWGEREEGGKGGEGGGFLAGWLEGEVFVAVWQE